jgi:hypothetical protein
MATLNNSFITKSAADISLINRNVMRWQFTKNYGKDIGTDMETLGPSAKPDKDKLIWKVALINGAGNKSAYGSAYTSAVAVLGKLDATKPQIDGALAALNAVNPGGGGGRVFNYLSSQIALLLPLFQLHFRGILPKLHARIRLHFLSVSFLLL